MPLTCSVADEIEYAALPEETKKLVERYFGIREGDHQWWYAEGYRHGYSLGYSRGYYAGRSFKEANG